MKTTQPPHPCHKVIPGESGRNYVQTDRGHFLSISHVITDNPDLEIFDTQEIDCCGCSKRERKIYLAKLKQPLSPEIGSESNRGTESEILYGEHIVTNQSPSLINRDPFLDSPNLAPQCDPPIKVGIIDIFNYSPNGGLPHGVVLSKIIADTETDNEYIKQYESIDDDFPGQSSIFNIICNIYKAIDDGIRIINISMGYYESYQNSFLKQAIEDAVKEGIFVIMSAGNDSRNLNGMNVKHWPSSVIFDENTGKYDRILNGCAFSIVALNQNGEIQNSNYGDQYCSTADFGGSGSETDNQYGSSIAAARFSRRILDSLLLGENPIDIATLDSKELPLQYKDRIRYENVFFESLVSV